MDGWLVIDKPFGMGSTNVVSKIKWSLSPQKIGHAGTLDPLATGILPIALGKATKLIPFVMDGKKTYEFEVTWGSETETDDAEGAVVQTSDKRPTKDEIKKVLSKFIGQIEQIPPKYSALKVDGKKAYDLARAGKEVQLKARQIQIDSLELIQFDKEKASFKVVCGKGTYVRSLGHDMGRELGCLGYITKLRRTICGPFDLSMAINIDTFQKKGTNVVLYPLNTALDKMPKICLLEVETKRVCQGQRLNLSKYKDCFDQEIKDGDIACIINQNQILGLVKIEDGVIHPYKIFQGV